jgi:hypothetical protein
MLLIILAGRENIYFYSTPFHGKFIFIKTAHFVPLTYRYKVKDEDIPYFMSSSFYTRSRIHEHTISLRFLGIILRVFRLEVSIYNVYITNQFQTTIFQGWRGVKSVSE